MDADMWFTIPNLFTALRIFMTPFVLYALANGRYLLAGWLFGGAALTDMLDGTVARHFGGETKFGAYLDPIADKFLLSGIYCGLAFGRAVPLWIVLVIFGRDLWILALSAAAFKFTTFRSFEPSPWGKASTFLQVMTAVALMGARGYNDVVLAKICNVLLAGIVILAIVSASEYTWRGLAWFRGVSAPKTNRIDLKTAGE
ncbi:MAG: CDP-alcohol phosphatidyltransferase family protein [Acidobacteriota bacterium]